jgi:RNA-directed DNA polymerase
LKKLNTIPLIRRQINAWLTAGVLDGKDLSPTESGVPQGGTISPLLMNVALHGLETTIAKQFYKKDVPLTIVKYADDNNDHQPNRGPPG